MKDVKLIEVLFKYGLGEYLVLHVNNGKSILGTITYEKGHIYLKDRDILGSIKPETLKPCWDNGLLGMICPPANQQWESLSFYGLKRCQLPVDLESTRHDILQAAENQFGETLIDFEGSIYRGFNLLLKNHFLPVILLHTVKSQSGLTGLAVTDLRAAPMSIKLIQKVHDIVRGKVDNHMSLKVQDTSLNSSDFNEIFKQYLQQDKG